MQVYKKKGRVEKKINTLVPQQTELRELEIESKIEKY